MGLLDPSQKEVLRFAVNCRILTLVLQVLLTLGIKESSSWWPVLLPVIVTPSHFFSLEWPDEETDKKRKNL
ncbi:phosphatidylinositol glycan anchor biosynthesis, class V, isoform CRA_b [Mus musculus]|nr:phosphatidylinositol glycan anchor biosynthesis, class V, isoform CRA_b [Mus musculus]